MSHLTEQDRCRIENLLNAGLSPLAIARRENRAHSTIVRELRNFGNIARKMKRTGGRRRTIAPGRRVATRRISASIRLGIVLGGAVCARSSNAAGIVPHTRRTCVRNWSSLRLSAMGVATWGIVRSASSSIRRIRRTGNIVSFCGNAVLGLTSRKPKSGNTMSCFVTAAARGKVFITS